MTEGGPPPIVVADSSPLIALSGIGRLDLLHRRFGRVAIPPAVHHEVVEMGRGRAGAREVRAASWIEVVTLKRPEGAASIQRAARRLGRGEAEAIQLCLDIAARHLLMDDQRGASAAATHGLQVVGTVGLLIEAQRLGHISDAMALIESAAARGLHLTDDVREEARARLREIERGRD